MQCSSLVPGLLGSSSGEITGRELVSVCYGSHQPRKVYNTRYVIDLKRALLALNVLNLDLNFSRFQDDERPPISGIV